ncbi:MAG: hypothetical protein J3R72DRAFT_428938 [Linnemannia gamsii]|nr:MAG: hypothetical protein J3R72DRAFT_428938 [Linnemannia gamsii]
MDTTSLEDLPYEIQGCVGHYLDQCDLRVCVGVSRAWRTMFHPLLWRHVHIVWRSDTSQSNTPTELKTNRHLIRSLKLECDGIYLHEFYRCCPPSLPSFPSLTSLEYKGQIYHKGGGGCELVDLIMSGGSAAAGGWKSLVFHLDGEWAYCYEFMPYFFDTLIEHAAPTLEVLRFEGVLTISGNDINRTLCSAPNLKQLRIAYDGIHGTSSCLNAQDIVKSEWICNDLEVFAWPIGSIPRPDITRDILGQFDFLGNGNLQENINLQRRVYAKLARLPKLRELSLGTPLIIDDVDYDSGDKELFRQYDCLAMTLDSGLDLLRDLKNLRIVGLADMEVYIDGDREQTWFAEHWPNATIGSTNYESDRDDWD